MFGLTPAVRVFVAAEDFTDNRPRAVRCVHPLVTLLEKLDALSRRYSRESIEADTFVRHYEDAARIVRALDRLPPSEIPARTLADDMLSQQRAYDVQHRRWRPDGHEGRSAIGEHKRDKAAKREEREQAPVARLPQRCDEAYSDDTP
jgi:hypothetical protein